MFIDPHAHMVSRTTDDYEAMAAAGIVALVEPAFWVGQPRTFVGTYVDYLSSLVDHGWNIDNVFLEEDTARRVTVSSVPSP